MAYSSVSYLSLLEQCAQHKPEALEKLIETEAPYFLALANAAIRHPNTAEDIVKESIVLIWKHACDFDPSMGSARAWLYGILRYRVQHHLKQNPHAQRPANTWPTLQLTNAEIKDKSWIKTIDSKTLEAVAYAYICNASLSDIAKHQHTSMHQCQQQIDDLLLEISYIHSNWLLESEKQIVLLGNYCLDLLREPEQALPAHQLLASNANSAHDLLQWEYLFSYLVYALNQNIISSTLSSRIFTELSLPSAQSSPAPTQAKQPVPTKPTLASTATPNDQAHTKKSLTTPSESLSHITQKNEIKHTSTPSNEALASDLSQQLAIQNDSAPLDQSLSSTFATAQTKRFIKTIKPWHWMVFAAILFLCAALVWFLTPKAPVVQLIQMAPRAGAIMQAPGHSATPGWVISVDSSGHLLFSPQVTTELRADQSVQLWTQAPNSAELRSLGLIDPNQPVTVPAELIGEVQIGQIFEMTLEQAGGASSPSSNVLFIGKIVQFGEFQENDKQSAI